MERSTKVQSPVALVTLSVVTLGIYACFWYYRVNREMRDYGRACGDAELGDSKPGRSVLAWIPGGWIVVPVVVSFAGTARRVARCERLVGIEPDGGGAIVALIAVATLAGLGSAFVGGSGAAILVAVDLVSCLTAVVAIQRRLNAVWQRDPLAAAATHPERAAAAA
jgi:hypothetical protein